MNYAIRRSEKIALRLLARQAQMTANATLRFEGRKLARLLQKLKTARVNRDLIHDRILTLEKRIIRSLNHVSRDGLRKHHSAASTF